MCPAPECAVCTVQPGSPSCGTDVCVVARPSLDLGRQRPPQDAVSTRGLGSSGPRAAGCQGAAAPLGRASAPAALHRGAPRPEGGPCRLGSSCDPAPLPLCLADPDWASYTLGVFICLSCSAIHRNIPQVSKVKSVRLDAWEEAQVEFMASHGNDAARATYESQVPSFYYRPTPSDCRYREGFLWKRGRDNGQFLSRKFVLTEREGALKYFNRHDAKEPKAIMKIEHLNATFQPAKIGHPHGLQVTYLKDNSTRNIFIYHEDGKEMADWFNALRAARFHYLQVAFPGASDADLVPKLTRNYLKEGYMEKTGPKVRPIGSVISLRHGVGGGSGRAATLRPGLDLPVHC
ncbi:Arf-GAP with dual PH domain-containing protein 1 [Myotis davidii]|uniref:Arf-GAP with dual PH domain-containing protein 1 n=1 Tax=Myotis davidii TaxID=225400 RepID=L5LUG4_MYODS|nr:Arf-GAP with dual PH domain-containing protein 1 [Myotis davidii]